MLPNNNRPPNFPMTPAGLVMPQGYIPPHQNHAFPQMSAMAYPGMSGHPQPFVSTVPALYYQQQQQRPYVPHLLEQSGRPRVTTDAMAGGSRNSEFAAQKQKLKAFGIKGAKAPPVSVDNMIENMFGKAPQKMERKIQSTVSAVPQPQEVRRPEPQRIASPINVSEPSTLVKKQASVKSLETMMQECSNITAGGTQRRLFGKGIPTTSTEPRNVFRGPTAQMPAQFPAWCCSDSVPPLYLQVEKFVSIEGQPEDGPQYDNSRLLLILMSSGLQKTLLARLWEVVSLTHPGTLTQKELYAILALVALCQAGYRISGPEVLLMLGTPPLPSLVLPCPVSQEEEPQQTQPTSAMSASSHPAATETVPASSPSPGTIVSSEEDDFDDFKQAAWSEPERKPEMSATHLPTVPIAPLNSTQEDRYSAFLKLEPQIQKETEEVISVSRSATDDFGDFLSADSSATPTTATFETPPFSFTTASAVNTAGTLGYHSSNTQTPVATVTMPEDGGSVFKPDFSSVGAAIFGTQDVNQPFHANFADFESQSQDVFAMSPTNEDLPDDNFTLFSCTIPTADTRLAETQSVASLELTPSVEQLSHHGSSQSLDSKTGVISQASLPSDDGSKHHQRSVSDGQGLVVKTLGSTCLESSESSVSLVDRYSSICSERTKVGGSCVQELGRCLSSCLKLLETGVDIFEQMSSTSVFHEVLAAKEVLDYIQNVKEVYTVTQRIRAATAVARCAVELQVTLSSIQKAWDALVKIILSSEHPSTPSDLSSPWLEFSSAVLSAHDITSASCGICLLDVNNTSATCWNDSLSALVKLSYSRRQYHATCANLWLNCVDPILPAFTLQELYSQ